MRPNNKGRSQSLRCAPALLHPLLLGSFYFIYDRLRIFYILEKNTQHKTDGESGPFFLLKKVLQEYLFIFFVVLWKSYGEEAKLFCLWIPDSILNLVSFLEFFAKLVYNPALPLPSDQFLGKANVVPSVEEWKVGDQIPYHLK